MACLGETLRDKATIGVEQNKPRFTPGVAKRVVSSATAKSNWRPVGNPPPLPRHALWQLPASATEQLPALKLHKC